jgi:hypothetical protein
MNLSYVSSPHLITLPRHPVLHVPYCLSYP